MLTGIKNRLLKGGPESPALRAAFRLQAKLHGVSMKIEEPRVYLQKGKQRIVVATKNMIFVPFAVHQWSNFFETLQGVDQNGVTTLDFSQPGMHHYRKSDVSFYFPSFAEDDCMDVYTASYHPKAGDVVWDVGAHAGTTTYFLAKMVGPEGKVFAFEPDENSYQYLQRNMDLHKMENVTLVKAALSSSTGTAHFVMDGTMGAGLADFIEHGTPKQTVEVQTLSLKDAAERYGTPTYIKLDIEGAELDMVKGGLEFLKQHPIQFAIETNHIVNGELTSGPMEELMTQAGYKAWSSTEHGQMFTWAQPPA